MYTVGMGITWRQVRKTAYDLAANLADKLPHLQGFSASRGWLYAFRKRHKAELTGRKQQNYERTRAANCNLHMMTQELQLRRLCLAELDRLNGGTGDGDAAKVKAHQLFNLDESGFSGGDQGRAQIACPVNQGNCQAIGDKHGDKVTAVLIVNAAGHVCPRFFILPGKRSVSKQVDEHGRLKGTEAKDAFTFSDSGNMTDEVSRHCP
jgi:hypothetical protein